MYARVTAVQGTPEKAEQGISSFKEKVLPAAQEMDGYKGAFLFVDRSTGKGLGMTLWTTEEARAAAAEALTKAREATLQAMEGGAPPVDEYEVVVSDLRA
jgi:heme-degrading monooxygenase HmoA